MMEDKQSQPADEGRLDPGVRPDAWWARAENGNIRAWTSAHAESLRLAKEVGFQLEPLYSQAALDAAVAAERDCRTCKSWTPHHRADVMHCSSPLRCVAGSAHKRQGVVQLWEAAPVDAGF